MKKARCMRAVVLKEIVQADCILRSIKNEKNSTGGGKMWISRQRSLGTKYMMDDAENDHERQLRRTRQ